MMLLSGNPEAKLCNSVFRRRFCGRKREAEKKRGVKIASARTPTGAMTVPRTEVVAYKDSEGRIVNFGRSTAQKAVWANKKHQVGRSTMIITGMAHFESVAQKKPR